MRRAALLLLLLVLLPGCVRFIYRRERVDDPVPEEKMAELTPGRELGECLDLLGAPARVWTDPRGVWLAYIWIDQKGPSISVSVPTGQIFVPGPSISYSTVVRRGKGVTLCFDDDLVLRFAQRGLTNLPEDEFDTE
ncbi:MAG: hypothetical protein ACYTGZ_02940 [Planctomycetota bacterium]|jgi:hypothetical protein